MADCPNCEHAGGCYFGGAASGSRPNVASQDFYCEHFSPADGPQEFEEQPGSSGEYCWTYQDEMFAQYREEMRRDAFGLPPIPPDEML